MSNQFVIIAGNPINGFHLWGPFKNFSAATKWATGGHIALNAWWISAVASPSEFERQDKYFRNNKSVQLT